MNNYEKLKAALDNYNTSVLEAIDLENQVQRAKNKQSRLEGELIRVIHSLGKVGKPILYNGNIYSVEENGNVDQDDGVLIVEPFDGIVLG